MGKFIPSERVGEREKERWRGRMRKRLCSQPRKSRVVDDNFEWSLRKERLCKRLSKNIRKTFETVKLPKMIIPK